MTYFLNLCCILLFSSCIVIKTSGKQQQVGECECEDIPPPGNFSCKDQKRFDKCNRKWMTDKGYCALSCGQCNCTPSDEKFPPQMEQSDPSSSTYESTSPLDVFSFVFTKPKSDTILARDLSPEPEQESIVHSEQDQQLRINDTQLLTLQQPYQQQQQQQQLLQLVDNGEQITRNSLGVGKNGECKCTDVAPPSTWKFTCEQHKLAGNCDHHLFIEDNYCITTCNRCQCLPRVKKGLKELLLELTSETPQQKSTERIIQVEQSPFFTTEKPQQKFLDSLLDFSSPVLEDVPIPQIEESDDVFEDILQPIATYQIPSESALVSDPTSPVAMLSSLLAKVQQASLNGTDTIASLNKTSSNNSIQPVASISAQEVSAQEDSTSLSLTSYATPLSSEVSSVTSPPIAEPIAKLQALAMELYMETLSPPPPLPPLPPPLSPTLSPPPPLPFSLPPPSIVPSIPTLTLQDTTLQFQRLSLPQLAFDLGIADVPLLNLQVIDANSSRNSINQVIITNPQLTPTPILQYGSNIGPNQQSELFNVNGIAPISNQGVIRGEGKLRTPECFLSALEEIDDLSLFMKVMHDVGTSLAHLIIPSDEIVTFIAPSNTAIMRLMYQYDIAFQQFLDAPPDILMALVSYHVLKGDLKVENIKNMGALDTMLGQLIYVVLDDEDQNVYLSGYLDEEAQLMKTDIQACGITLHTIDTLIIPQGLDEQLQAVFLTDTPTAQLTELQENLRNSPDQDCHNNTLEQVLESYQNMSAALFSLQQSNSLQILEDGPLTMFVPADKVFLQAINQQLGSGNGQLWTSIRSQQKGNMLLHHIVEGQTLTLEDLQQLSSLNTTYPGGTINITREGSQVFLQSGESTARITQANLGNSCDIIVHTIDNVLFPQVATSIDDDNVDEQGVKVQTRRGIETDVQQRYQQSDELKILTSIVQIPQIGTPPINEKMEEIIEPLMEDVNNVPFGDAIVPLDSPIEPSGRIDLEQCQSVGASLEKASDLSIMSLWLMNDGFQDLLSDKEIEVTILAPTNKAFGELINEIGMTLESLQNEPSLWNIFTESLALHVINKPLRFQDFLNPLEAKTQANNSKGFSEIIEFEPVLPSTVRIIAPASQSRIVGAAIKACGSYIYPIDEFLLTEHIHVELLSSPPPPISPPPPSQEPQAVQVGEDAVEDGIAPCLTIDEVIMKDPRMVSFQTLLQRAGLLDIVGDARNITIFVPQNDGMSVILRALYDDVIELNGNALQVWSGYHIVPGIWSYKSLTQGTLLSTMAGGADGALSLEVEINPGKGNANGPIVNLVGLSNAAQIIDADIRACGAILHILDGPLLPVERDRG